MQAALKARCGRGRFQRGCNGAEAGAAAGRRDQHDRRSAHQHRSAEQRIESFCRNRRGTWAGPFIHRIGLAGQQRFIGLRGLGFQHDAVSGREVAGGKLDHIARNDILDRGWHGVAVAAHRRVHGDRALQSLDRGFRAVFLDQLQPDRHAQNCKNDNTARPVAGYARNKGRDDKDGDQRIDQPLHDLAKHPLAHRRRDHIGSALTQAACHLVRAQPCRRGGEARQHVGRAAAPKQIARWISVGRLHGPLIPIVWARIRRPRVSRRAWPSPARWPWPYPSARHICRAARR